MKLPVLYSDDDVMVVDKPAGITVNRAETTIHETTVQDVIEELWGPDFKQEADEYLLKKKAHTKTDQWDPEIDFYTRAGIVHRLDKETSGALIIAKNLSAFVSLQSQFKERVVKKTYLALAHGKITPSVGEINVPVGRLPWNRNRFGILPGGRESKTEYEVIGLYSDPKNRDIVSLVKLHPQTGRTHQIRVHLQYIGHSIYSDFLYAGRKTARSDRRHLSRVFLHAARITFLHPVTKKEITLDSPMPKELQDLLETLTSTQ